MTKASGYSLGDSNLVAERRPLVAKIFDDLIQSYVPGGEIVWTLRQTAFAAD